MNSAADPRIRASWLALVAAVSVCLSLTALYVGPQSASPFVSSLFLPVVLFAVFAYAVRWLVLRDVATSDLSARFLLIIGGAKIALFLALALLALECVAWAVFRPDSGQVMLGTFVKGVLAFAVLNIALGAVVNSLVVARKLLKR
jgi:hypothetical protein